LKKSKHKGKLIKFQKHKAKIERHNKTKPKVQTYIVFPVAKFSLSNTTPKLFKFKLDPKKNQKNLKKKIPYQYHHSALDN
jgi:hypothetical protein